MNMNTEPIRLPALIALVVVVACAIAVSLLLDLDPADAVALVVGVLALFTPALAVTESKRARTDSPATIQALHAQYAADRADSAGITIAGDPASVLDLSTPPAVDEISDEPSVEQLLELLAERLGIQLPEA